MLVWRRGCDHVLCDCVPVLVAHVDTHFLSIEVCRKRRISLGKIDYCWELVGRVGVFLTLEQGSLGLLELGHARELSPNEHSWEKSVIQIFEAQP